MLAIHFCSDQSESLVVLQGLVDEAQRRVASGMGVLPDDSVRVFWVNPVADLRVMNLLEDVGGRICGTEYLFSHALDQIPEDVAPMEALARAALADAHALLDRAPDPVTARLLGEYLDALAQRLDARTADAGPAVKDA